MNKHIEYLGKEAIDKVTGFRGHITSVSFDLFGCICAVISPPLDKDGKMQDGKWVDINRIDIVSDKRCMPIPKFGEDPQKHEHGANDKPARSR